MFDICESVRSARPAGVENVSVALMRQTGKRSEERAGEHRTQVGSGQSTNPGIELENPSYKP